MRRVVDGLGGFTGRGACTDAERRAALWLHADVRGRGRDAWVETRWVRPQRAAALALACLAAVAGGLLSTVAPVPGLAIAVAGLVALAADALGRNPLLLPRRSARRARPRQAGAATAEIVEIGPCEQVDDAAMEAALELALEDAERRQILDRL